MSSPLEIGASIKNLVNNSTFEYNTKTDYIIVYIYFFFK